jgi:hypothetical protein
MGINIASLIKTANVNLETKGTDKLTPVTYDSLTYDKVIRFTDWYVNSRDYFILKFNKVYNFMISYSSRPHRWRNG